MTLTTTNAAPVHRAATSLTGFSWFLPLVVWIASVLVLIPVALAYRVPGFMDAYYYFHVAANLASGRGFVEDVIWIYLTDPPAVTHPSNLYWMPLTSIIAAPFLAWFGQHFHAAQAPFVIFSGIVPAATAAVAGRVFGGNLKPVAAAGLTLFGGFYFAYWVAIDGFAVFTLAAMVVFLATTSLLSETSSAARTAGLSLLVGVGAAVAHLTRADGPLLFVSSAGVLLLWGRRRLWRRTSLALVVGALAYLAAMAPWLARNLAVSGSPLAVGGSQTLFLTNYNEIFSYGVALSPARYLDQGLAAIIEGKALAAGRNLAVLFGFEYWLIPFAVVGWWSLRRVQLLGPPLLYGIVLYGTMTLLFTFPSGRGSMLHSSVVLLPWLCIAAVQGIERVVFWIARRLPHWNPPVAARNFTLIFLAFSAAASAYLVVDQTRTWEQETVDYAERAPIVYAEDRGAIPMVLNPPAWWYVTRGRAIQTPSNGPDAAIAVAQRYGATHLIIEPIRARDWGPFVRGEAPDARFELLDDHADYRVYRLRP